MTNKIDSIEALRKTYNMPMDATKAKKLPCLEPHAIAFINICPFLVISSSDGAGQADASPRGEGPGFVKVIDNNTIIIPDRPGNNLLDTLENIIRNPSVGLLFMVPGMNETLRINGQAEISIENDLLDLCLERDKPPKSVIKVRVESSYMHCPKAFIRSKLWDADAQIDRSTFPTLGKIIKDQLKLDVPTMMIDASLDEDAKNNLF